MPANRAAPPSDREAADHFHRIGREVDCVVEPQLEGVEPDGDGPVRTHEDGARAGIGRKPDGHALEVAGVGRRCNQDHQAWLRARERFREPRGGPLDEHFDFGKEPLEIDRSVRIGQGKPARERPGKGCERRAVSRTTGVGARWDVVVRLSHSRNFAALC